MVTSPELRRRSSISRNRTELLTVVRGTVLISFQSLAKSTTARYATTDINGFGDVCGGLVHDGIARKRVTARLYAFAALILSVSAPASPCSPEVKISTLVMLWPPAPQ